MENKLIPSVEKRIAAWADVSKKQQERKNKEQKTKTITISREFGCEGFPLALELKSLLDAQTKEIWTIFDELLIDKIQEDRQISKSLLKGFGEQSTFMDNLLSMLVPNWDTEEEAYRSIVETIFAIAKEGNAIIVGRGGSVITQSLSNCYHFRLIAPKDFRVQVTATRMKISFDEAEKEIELQQAKRDSFINKFLKCNMNDPSYYHALYNNKSCDINKIAKSILYTIGLF